MYVSTSFSACCLDVNIPAKAKIDSLGKQNGKVLHSSLVCVLSQIDGCNIEQN